MCIGLLQLAPLPPPPHTLTASPSRASMPATPAAHAQGVKIFLEKFALGDCFTQTYSRAWTGGRPKPAPDGILAFCKSQRLDVGQVMMVGDWKDDMAAGLAAGCTTVLKATPEGSQRANQHLREQAHHVIDELPEVLPLLR